MSILISACAVCLVIGLAFAALLRKLTIQGRTLPSDFTPWISQLSVERYRPMERLLDERDFQFLESQPGGGRKLARALRAERRRIFRSYLAGLSRDFSRLCAAIQMVMLRSSQDRPDLAAILLQQRIAFTLGLLAVHGKLLLHAWGMGQVDVSRLLGAFDGMRLELQQMLQPAAA